MNQEIQPRAPEKLSVPSHDYAVEMKAEHGFIKNLGEHTTAVGQDSMLVNHEAGLYGIFDGMGGHPNGDIASSLAAEKVSEELINGNELDSAMEAARQKVANDAKGGLTTALFIRLVETSRAPVMEWANAGDCRLGLVREDKIEWINSEQADLFSVHNGLGSLSHWPRVSDEFGQQELQAGDTIILASDGITGNVEPFRLPDEEILKATYGSPPAKAATKLIKISAKKDDKSLIVLKIQ